MWDLLWPVACAGCGQEGGGRLCTGCRVAVAERVPAAAGVRRAYALAAYDTSLGQAVRLAKYRPDRRIAVALAGALSDALVPVLRDAPIDAVTPAPSAWDRRMSRGFSLPAILARSVAAALQLPLVPNLVQARGPRQAGLSRMRRRQALGGRVRSFEPVAGTLLLVDDVVTTGATAAACARELLGSGATEVWLATLCVTRISPDDVPVLGHCQVGETGPDLQDR